MNIEQNVEWSVATEVQSGNRSWVNKIKDRAIINILHKTPLLFFNN